MRSQQKMILGWLIMAAVLIGLARVIGRSVSSGHERKVREEAVRLGCEVLSIRPEPLALFRGPFAWEFRRHASFYRVTCRDDTGGTRTAVVMVVGGWTLGGDPGDTFSWRWDDDRWRDPGPIEKFKPF